jgi:hypothetical protein
MYVFMYVRREWREEKARQGKEKNTGTGGTKDVS